MTVRKVGPIVAGIVLGGALLIGLMSNGDVLFDGAYRGPALTATPSNVPVGGAYTLGGSGFKGHPLVLLTYSDGETSLIVYPNKGGQFSVNSRIPATAAIGTKITISAYDYSGGQVGALLARLNG